MNKSFTLLLLVCILSWVSCQNNPNQYVITGNPVAEEFNGKTVKLLKDNGDSSIVIDSAIIKNGKFSMKSEVSSPFLATLSIETGTLPYLLPVAIEPGRINVMMTDRTAVWGTPLNARLQQFMVDKDDWEDSTQSTPLEERNKEFALFMEKQIQATEDCQPLQEYIKKHYRR